MQAMNPKVLLKIQRRSKRLASVKKIVLPFSMWPGLWSASTLPSVNLITARMPPLGSHRYLRRSQDTKSIRSSTEEMTTAAVTTAAGCQSSAGSCMGERGKQGNRGVPVWGRKRRQRGNRRGCGEVQLFSGVYAEILRKCTLSAPCAGTGRHISSSRITNCLAGVNCICQGPWLCPEQHGMILS